MRAGYGITNDPYSLARPLRANYPILLAAGFVGPNAFQPEGLLRDGIPQLKSPDLGNGVIDMPLSAADPIGPMRPTTASRNPNGTKTTAPISSSWGARRA